MFRRPPGPGWHSGAAVASVVIAQIVADVGGVAWCEGEAGEAGLRGEELESPARDLEPMRPRRRPGDRSTQDATQLEGSQKGRAARSAPLSVTELLELREVCVANVATICTGSHALRRVPGYRSTQDAIQLEGSQKGRAARSAPLSVTELLKFVDAGGNVAFFGEKPSPDMRKFANECGVDFHRPSTQLWDFAAEDGVTVPARIRTEAAVVVDGDDFPSGVTYRGLTHSVAGSQLTFNVLSGSGSTFVTAADGKTQLVAGESVSLVSAMQARNSARVTFAGSDSLCEENERFCSELTRWAFREKGILRMSNLHSHKVGESVQPYMYRVMDDIVFNIDIEEWKHGEWRPYVANDVQLEFVMLDPHVRLFLDPPEPSQKGSGGSKGGKKTYSKTFKSPDVYGVFKFKIDYARVGYNRLHVEELAPVRNFKHNDYERFIWCAGPYYTSCLLVPVSLLLFVSVFLYHKEDPKKGGKLI
eukprot:g3621.t1